MAIIGPADLPVVLQIDSTPMKKYVLSMLGHPVTEVELEESQMETVLKTTGDFIAHYFPKEQKYSYFYTQPLVQEYDMPSDAYWIYECAWDPAVSSIVDIFSAEAYLFNIGNISGIQNIMTDYVLLQQYRRFTARILGNEGHWEVLGDKKIRLFPTPKGAFPVVVVYCPVITSFRSPITRKLCMDMLLAESMIMLGMSRNKFSGIPSPDGGSLSMNGADLVTQGMEKRKSIIEEANYLAEPMPILRFALSWLMISLVSLLALGNYLA